MWRFENESNRHFNTSMTNELQTFKVSGTERRKLRPILLEQIKNQ